MANNYTNATAAKTQNPEERNSFVYKLRISVIFSFCAESQIAKCKSYRDGQQITACVRGENLPMELAASEVEYVDEDDKNANYIILDRKFRVDERSPKAMENLAKCIDDYVLGFCLREDAERVIPNIFIPTFGEWESVVHAFFASFTLKCLGLASSFHHKLDTNNTIVLQFGFSEIVLSTGRIAKTESYKNEEPKNLTYKIFALASYYTYFYLDYLEHKEDSWWKRNLADEKIISGYFARNSKAQEKGFWSKIGSALVNIGGFPISVVKAAIVFLFSYDTHLENRIFSRIIDVIDIVNPGCSDDDKKKIIGSIMNSCHDQPLTMFDFFRYCNYWDYIESSVPGLKDECRKWRVKLHDRTQITGYGAVLFQNDTNHIYCFKGTDFDSLGKDWLATNLLQGLTGTSLQHAEAIEKAQLYHTEIGDTGNLWFVGHSLGGGLASAATISTKNRTGYTFNAAGLNVMGVKTMQLNTNLSSVFHPSQDWNRVFPYRIKGEVLDTLQKTALRVVSLNTLERGYGKKSVEYDMSKKKNCLRRHGINNFLYAEVMTELKNFNQVAGDFSSSKNNKVKEIIFKTQQTRSKSELLC